MKRGPLALNIAWRYLWAPKSHGAVGAISIVSVAGVAVATAAIIVVLSVFNGFRYHLNARLDSLSTDVTVEPAIGKTIANADSLKEVLSTLPGIKDIMPEVSDNALVIYQNKEMPITLKGVMPQVFSKITSIDSLIIDGKKLSENTPSDASLSVGVAQRLGILNPGDTILIFAPKRHGRVNISNPISSFLTDSLSAVSIFRSMQSDYDENTLICDISVARELFQYETEATSLQINGEPGVDAARLAKSIKERLGSGYIVKDRLEQQALSFRMVAIEKWITFILLTFILLIASFNIISTLCMIILDKGSSIITLSHIGLNKSRIGNIFWWESILVTLLGAVIGIILGVAASLLQEKFGFIKLDGDPQSLIIQAYPVRVEWLDIAITMIPVSIIGIITAWISYAFSKARVRRFS